MPAKTNPFDRLSPLLSNTIVQVAFLAVMALVCYANSLQVPFVFDDLAQIRDNPVIRSLANFFANRSGYDDVPNRYVAYLSFALNYHAGGLNVTGYHVVNLAIHIANGLLVYSLVRLIFRTPFFVQGSAVSVCGSERAHQQPSNLVIPLVAALLFACHPIQTQAVTYVVQRVTSLATLFYLASLVLHIRWRVSYEAGRRIASTAILPWYLLSLLSAVLAMKTKEIAFTLPAVILLVEVCFFGRPDRKLLALLLPMLLTVCIIPLSMLNLNKSVGELFSDVSSVTAVRSPLSRWEYLLTQFSVIVTYLRLLVLPINQNLDYDYPENHSLLEPRAFLSLAVLLAFLGLALYLWRKSSGAGPSASNAPYPPNQLAPGAKPLQRLAAFGILWFFVTLMVESSLIPIVDVIFEHRVYLPSVGFFLVVASLSGVLLHSPAYRKPLFATLSAAILLLVVISLSIATVKRNRVWQSALSLWKDNVMKSPGKGGPHQNLGLAYGSLGNFEMAKRERQIYDLIESKKLVRKDPNNPNAHYHLGNVYREQGLYADAIREYLETIRLRPDSSKVYNNLGLTYLMAGNQELAIRALTTAVSLDPGNQSARDNLNVALRVPKNAKPH